MAALYVQWSRMKRRPAIPFFSRTEQMKTGTRRSNNTKYPSPTVENHPIFVRSALASRRPCRLNEKLTAFVYANAIDAHDNDDDGDDDDDDNMSNK